MKGWLLGVATFTMLAGYAMATITPTEPTFDVTKGCYQIGSADELFGFASLVNDGKHRACAQLTADIADASDSKTTAWTPIEDYSGYFEGNGHTISGLYYSNKRGLDVGLFGSISSGAIIKNVKLADVDIFAGGVAGGLVGTASGTDIIIDGCGVSGSVDGSYDIGGLVGNISKDAEVTIANSYSAAIAGTSSGTVQSGADQNSLIGFAYEDATVNLFNCFTLLNDKLVGNSHYLFGCYTSTTINANSLECNSDGKYKCSYYNIVGDDQYETVVNGVTALDDGDKLDSIFDANASSSDYQSTYVTPVYTASTYAAGKLHALNINTLSLRGVTIASTENGIVATLDDSVDSVLISADVTVDSVVLAREFTVNVHSTLAVPFNATPSQVVGGTMCELDSMTHNEDGSLKGVDGSPASSISAFYAYLISPTAEQISFTGPITLNQITTGEFRQAALHNDANWLVVGMSYKKRWQRDSLSAAGDTLVKGENTEDIGHVYGFAGTAVTKNGTSTGYSVGDFVKVGTKVSVRPMRGFLFYVPGSWLDSSPQSMPSAPGMAMAPALEVLSIEDLPERLEVVIHYPTSDSTLQGETIEEKSTAIEQVKVPTNVIKTNRWFDVTGRSLKNPKAKGAYINNRTPVIVK